MLGLVELQTHDQSVAGSIPSRSGKEDFLLLQLELNFYADPHSVSIRPQGYCSGMFKTLVFPLKVQYAYILDPTKSVWADCAVHVGRNDVGFYQENKLSCIGCRRACLPDRECLSTVTSACWATVDWSLAVGVKLMCVSWSPSLK